MTPQTKRFLFGCAGGCGALVLLLVGGCVAFTVWINSPGELLDPATLLDEDSVGHLEWRLDLDNPGTAAMVEATLDALDSSSAQATEALGESGVIRWIFAYNQRRQERELRQLFPATAVMSLRPHADGDGEVALYSVSIQRLGHRIQVGDWLSGWFFRFSDVPAERYRGETILSIDGMRDEGEGEEGQSGRGFHAFLHPQGLFFADNLEAAKRGVDRLLAPTRPGARLGELEQRFAALPTDASLRGVVLNGRGELVRLLQRLPGEEIDRLDLDQELQGVTALEIFGGATAGGDLVLQMTLSGAGDGVEERARDVVERLREDLEEKGYPLEGGVRRSARGVEVELRLVDVGKTIRELGPEGLDFELKSSAPVEDPGAE